MCSLKPCVFIFFNYSKDVLKWGVEGADMGDKTQSQLRLLFYLCSEGSEPHRQQGGFTLTELLSALRW